MPKDEEFIPLSTPWLAGREREYLLECIDSGWVAAGPYIDRFENSVAQLVGSVGAVAVSSGTAALHVALHLLGVGSGDAVLCPTLTFVATTNAIVYTGARPIFLDNEPTTMGVDPASLRNFIETQCSIDSIGTVTDTVTGLRIKALVVVHLYGHPADMDPILEISQEYGLPVIEDATESIGSLYHNRPTGSMGLIGCFSFNGNKTVTSGGGGMIVSTDEELISRSRSLINQAKSAGSSFFHEEMGFNYRLSNLHAAVGLAQFERLEDFLEARRGHALRYAEALSEVPGITFCTEQPWVRSNYWLSTILVDPEVIEITTDKIMKTLGDRGIEVRRPFVPNHQLPPYQNDRTEGNLESALSLYQRALNLPSSGWLSSAHLDRVIKELTLAIA